MTAPAPTPSARESAPHADESGSLFEGVRAILPIIEEHRQWADEHARMAQPVLDACREAGVFTVVAPREVGGIEPSLPEIFSAFENLAYADPTVAWHAANSMIVCQLATVIAEEERDRIFAGPRGPFGFSGVPGGARAERVEGGYLLSGRWPFVTGVLDAPWAALSGIVHEQGQPVEVDGVPEIRRFIVAHDDLVVEDTWGSASAMRGTGSYAASVEETFIPLGRTYRPGDPDARPNPDRPLYRVPPAISGLPLCAAIGVGIARRVVDEASATAGKKVSRIDGIAFRDRSGVQRTISRAHAAVGALSEGMAGMARDVWQCAEAGAIAAPVRAQLWSTSGWTLDQARQLVSEMVPVSTSAVYASRNAVESGLRDLHAAVASVEPFRSLEEAAGRVFLGAEPNHPAF